MHARSTAQPSAGQLRLDEAEAPLSSVTFVVVDLETTGGRAGTDAITEIGAVKVRGGEVLGEFATLVDPGRPIPSFITRLTGITAADVTGAPPIGAVLHSFLEFAHGCVLVAHNARFDVGFLKAAAESAGTPWPGPPVLCTVRLARSTLSRDEAPSVRLSELARLFRVATTPTHRALDDARATVDVLHGLIGRAGSIGVHTLSDLLAQQRPVSREQVRKRHLAADLPHAPGVYLFRGPSGEALYVGTALDLRRRVHTYFTGSETRTRMKEMVALVTRVDHVVCAHGLEAQVREFRLIGAHAPPYNRAAKSQRNIWWIDLTAEAFPRPVVHRKPGPDALGPFRSRSAAGEAAAALAAVCGLRSCTRRIPASGIHGPGCTAYGTAGGCPAAGPGDTAETADDYARRAERARRLIAGHTDAPLEQARDRIAELSAAELFESAARHRDRLGMLVRALDRAQRLRALAALDTLTAARPDGAGGWDFAVIRAGRLAAAGTAPRGTPPMPVVDLLEASAETAPHGPGPLRGATEGETAIVARWISLDGTRIVRSDAAPGYRSPIRAAARWHDWSARADAGRTAAAWTGRPA